LKTAIPERRLYEGIERYARRKGIKLPFGTFEDFCALLPLRPSGKHYLRVEPRGRRRPAKLSWAAWLPFDEGDCDHEETGQPVSCGFQLDDIYFGITGLMRTQPLTSNLNLDSAIRRST
jgi:hypothetical protein